jgi:hypothetical protein
MQIVVLHEITLTLPKWTPTITERLIGLCNENPQTHTFPPPEMINSWHDTAENVLKRA